jgi:chromosomal replication initiator protein
VQQGDELWHQIQQALQANLSKPTFETWIRPARALGFSEGKLRLEAPTAFACGWLRKHYLTQIQALGTELSGKPVAIEVVSAPEQPQASQAARGSQGQVPIASEGESRSPARDDARTPKGAPPTERPPAGLNPRYRFSRFVVGPNSRMAHAAALAVAQGVEPRAVDMVQLQSRLQKQGAYLRPQAQASVCPDTATATESAT